MIWLFLFPKESKLTMKTFEHSRFSDSSPKRQQYVMIRSPSEKNDLSIDYIIIRNLFWIKSLIILLVCGVCLMRVAENAAEV
jgi:hypothetical protein